MNLNRALPTHVMLFVLLPVAVPAAYGQNVVHYWNFESNFDDQVGSAHGTVTAQTTVTFDVGHDGNSAMRAQALTNSEDDFVSIDSSQTFNPGSNPFSFSYWFKIENDGTSNPRGLFDFSGDGFDGAQSLYIGTTDNLAFRVDAVGGGAPALVATNFEDGNWHFIVATYDPVTGTEVHVDGPGVEATAGGFGSVTFDTNQYLGTFNFSNPDNKGLDGLLDDLAIYNGILNNNQIQGLFDGFLNPTDIGSNSFVPPDSFVVFRGFQIGGDLADFADSDDNRALFNPGFVLNSSEAPVWLVFDANAPGAINILVESQAGTPGLTYTVEAWNWPNNNYNVMGVNGESFNNDVVATFMIDPGSHVDINGNVRSRIGWRRTGLTINFPWETRIDQTGWNQLP